MNRVISEQTVIAVVGIVGSILTGLLAWVTGQRRGAADAREVDARADVMVSTEARAILAEVRTERTAERTERLRVEEELEAERKEHAATRERLTTAERGLSHAEHEIAMLKRDVADLKRMIKAMGGTPPGETPAHGTPAVAPVPEGGAP